MNPAKSTWITGAAGLLGANLTLEFLDRGLRVLPITRNHGLHISNVSSVACDLAEPRAVEDLFARQQPSLIVHCAAATNIDWCEANPDEAMRINAESAGLLAAQARTCGARFVHISTDAVFNGVSGGYSESDPADPLNVYARTKLAGERAVLGAMPDALILRVNLYGWNLQPKFSLAEWVLDRLESHQSIPGFRDVTFAPIFANTLAAFILRLTEPRSSGIFHAGSSDHMSKFDFARQIAEVFGLDPSLILESSVAESSLTAPRSRNLWLRTEKLSEALGHPMPTIRQGLESFKALRENGFTRRLKAAASPKPRSAVECQR